MARGRLARGGRAGATVERVARHRVADRGEVDADLVRAAAVDADAEQRGAVEALERAPAGPRLASARGSHRHALAANRVAADRPVDLAGRARGDPEHERHVLLLDRARGELARERPVRRIVLGDDQQPGRAAVEPVHDAGAEHAPDPGQVAHPGEQRVDERAARGTRTGVDDQAGRLVHDDDRLVLVHHAQRDVLGRELRRGGGGDHDAARWPGLHARRSARRGRVEPHVARRDQRLQTGARERGQPSREPRVEPQAGVFGPDHQLEGLFHGSGRQAVAAARVRLRRGSSSAQPSSSTIAITCEVETAPLNQEPRSGSPRRNSRLKRTAE